MSMTENELSQRTVALQKPRACPWKKKDKVVWVFFFPESLYVARTIKERRWMRSTMSESNLISFLSQFVNSVNRCLCTDAGINDVSLSLLSALVALSQASSLLSFIISITKKRGRGGIWKKKVRHRWERNKGLMVRTCTHWFTWSDHAYAWAE